MVKKLSFVVVLVLVTFGCEDFLSGPLLDQDPNKIDEVAIVSPEALLVGSQVTMYGVMEGYLNRAVSMVTQQMSGLQTDYYRDFNCDPIDINTNGRWTAMYGTGGLIDLKTIQSEALKEEKYILRGIAQMWEALIFSTAADLWGSIPYSEAADPEYAKPKFDTQRSVHMSVLSLIDNAIENFGKGQVFAPPTQYDFTFAADVDRWIAAAHTLKARIYLNWAEVEGAAYYSLALEEAQQGIVDVSGSGDWKAIHGSAIAERSVWFQFMLSNSGYMGAGKLLVDMLKSHSDDRLGIYFLSTGEPEIVGVSPEDTSGFASLLNITGAFGMTYEPEFVSWYENSFIISECHYNLGNESLALSMLNSTIDGLKSKWQSATFQEVSIPSYENISGDVLLESIMNEKYKALFLNMQSWSDIRRTGYPGFIDQAGNNTECSSGIPRRLLYPEKEKSINSNCPQGDTIYDRLENDPN